MDNDQNVCIDVTTLKNKKTKVKIIELKCLGCFVISSVAGENQVFPII